MNKILVMTRLGMAHPIDIFEASPIVRAMARADRIHRVYAPDQLHADKLIRIVEELQK